MRNIRHLFTTLTFLAPLLATTEASAQGSAFFGAAGLGMDLPLMDSLMNSGKLSAADLRQQWLNPPPELQHLIDPEEQQRKEMLENFRREEPEVLELKLNPGKVAQDEWGDLPEWLQQEKTKTPDDVIAEKENEINQALQDDSNPKVDTEEPDLNPEPPALQEADSQEYDKYPIPIPARTSHDQVPILKAMHGQGDKKSENDNTDDKTSEEQTSGSEEQQTSQDEVHSKALITPGQIDISNEELISEEQRSALERTASTYLPSIKSMVIAGALTYGLIRATGVQSTLARATIISLTFATTYFIDLMNRVNHQPEGYFEYHGVFADIASQVVFENIVSNAYAQEHERVMQSVDLSRLFGEFCRKLQATEAQYPAFFNAFYMGIMMAWASSKKLEPDSEEFDKNQMTREWLLKAAHTYLKHSRKLKPEDKKNPVIKGSEVAVRHKAPKRAATVVTRNGDLNEAQAFFSQLANGYYTVQGMRCIILLDNTRETRQVILFFPFSRVEVYFESRDAITAFLLAVNKAIPAGQGLENVLIVNQLPIEAFANVLYFGGQLETEDEKADEQLLATHARTMELNPDNLPDADELKRQYRRLARERHPDKRRDDPKSGNNFDELKRAFLFIEGYIQNRDPDEEESD